MRLIDADESLKRINDIFPRRTESDYQKGIAVGMAMAKVAIHEQPTVDAEPVRHGRWMPICLTSYPPQYRQMCSCCGHRHPTSEKYNYCPVCGTKMDEEEPDATFN